MTKVFISAIIIFAIGIALYTFEVYTGSAFVLGLSFILFGVGVYGSESRTTP